MAFQIVKIPDLPVASSITGTDQFPVEQSDGTKSVTQSVLDTYNAGKFLRKNVNESTTGSITSSGFSTVSTIKYKENVTPLKPDVIKLLAELLPVQYTFKADSPIKPGQNDVGLIAEDVEKLLPVLIVKDENGIISIDYSKLSVFLLLAVQALTKRVQELESK